jgi:putative ABC transport system permease protein
MQELKEVEVRYNAVHSDDPINITAGLKSHYAAVWQDLGSVFSAWGSNLTWYVAPAILLLLLVPALNLSGMVAARMLRRLPEMAVRKAFGAKRRTLLWQVIRENLTLTLIGGLLGLCLAWLALYAWRDWAFYIFSGIYGQSPVVPILRGEMFLAPAIFLIALVICCTLNVMAATLPAWWSLRKPIIQGLMAKQ